MRRVLIIAGLIVFMAFIAVSGYSEITLSQGGGKLKAVGANATLQLDGATKSGTVTDLNGGVADIAYDAASGAIDAKGSGTLVGFTYSITKIYLDPGESVKVSPTAAYGGFTIQNTSSGSDILAIFPDMSKISMPVGSQVEFMKLADGSYYMKVKSGSVLYTDPEGNTRTLTTSSPPMYVKGFETEPGWRSDELPTNAPATP